VIQTAVFDHLPLTAPTHGRTPLLHFGIIFTSVIPSVVPRHFSHAQVRENEPGYEVTFHVSLSCMSYFVWEGGCNMEQDHWAGLTLILLQ